MAMVGYSGRQKKRYALIGFINSFSYLWGYQLNNSSGIRN